MPKQPGSKQQSFLFLQGLASPFLSILARELASKGTAIHRINYCGGDWWFARGGPPSLTKTNFSGKHTILSETYRSLIKKHNVTTLVMFGDCRPIHQIARTVADEEGINIVVFEEGYTRPHWVTCEFDGTNNNSPLPRTAEAIKKRAALIAENESTNDGESFPQLPKPMPPRVKMDLKFHAANICSFWYFRHYQTHRPEKVSAELRGWIARFFRKIQYKTTNTNLVSLYETTTEPFFLVPLQLNSDFQIREHSNYDGVPDFIAETIASFAANASKKARLLFKSHPLDNGMIDYRSLIGTSTAIHGISDRVHYIEGGDLDTLLDTSKGVVLINSTVGFAALKQYKPMKVMGRALYDIKGLTHQGPLNSFWKKAKAPTKGLADDFLSVVRTDSQIYGDFFTSLGMELAATAAATRLMAGPNPAESEKSL